MTFKPVIQLLLHLHLALVTGHEFSEVTNKLSLPVRLLFKIVHGQSSLFLSRIHLVFLSDTDSIHSRVPGTAHDVAEMLKILDLVRSNSNLTSSGNTLTALDVLGHRISFSRQQGTTIGSLGLRHLTELMVTQRLWTNVFLIVGKLLRPSSSSDILLDEDYRPFAVACRGFTLRLRRNLFLFLSFLGLLALFVFLGFLFLFLAA
mmetsp:Transcript_42724/g.93224  ORF Transcript_42724/g.93224 Transcript_42724/m.93224 type:complete len:204 (+) Transcript_42724:190-801(+)